MGYMARGIEIHMDLIELRWLPTKDIYDKQWPHIYEKLTINQTWASIDIDKEYKD